MRKLTTLVMITALLMTTPTAVFAKVALFDEGENGDTAVLKGKFVIDLQTNPSTGYDWHITYRDESKVALRKVEYYDFPDDVDGAPGRVAFTFKTVGSGYTHVELKYFRESDGPATAVDTYILYLDIR